MRAPPDLLPEDIPYPASRYGPGQAVSVWITARHKAFLARIGGGERGISEGARRVIEAHPEWEEKD